MDSLPASPALFVKRSGFPDCERCLIGEFESSFRILVKNSSDSRPHLFHVHNNENFQSILLRLCTEFPEEWFKGTVYYFYIDIGGIFHSIEEASWLRDKDVLIVTHLEDLEDLPSVSLNAVHASLRKDVTLREHQIEGVNRMILMERSQRGGILADDMGLGKTIQTLTVILRQQPLTTAQASTLVIVPSRGIGDQWAEEIRTKTTYGSLPYFLYQDDSMALIDQPCFRVIITTYDRVRGEYKKLMKGIEDESPLFQMDWHRIVLDESHKVRVRTMLASAVTALKGKFKWCLSGTPFQNDITELYPIFTFLGIDLDPRRKHEEDYVTDLLKSHMIRRTKAILHRELTILPRRENRITLEFSAPERALYDYLERLLYHQISLTKQSGDRNHHVVSAAILYLRLKQVCGHHMILLDKFPDLIPMARSGSDYDTLNNLQDGEVNRERNYYDEASEYEQALEIIESYYDQFGNLQEPLDLSQLQRLKFIKNSTKVTWLITFLKQLLSAEPSDKIVVVSQFVDAIIKIAEMLTNTRIPFETYHGGMSVYSRKVALQKFNHDPLVRVMVMSLKAGGVGLNLQKANHMIILDRWWNPATMDQAVARIHRMTQVKETYIHTVVIKDTIEESLMDNILDKKNALFQKIVEYDNVDEDQIESEVLESVIKDPLDEQEKKDDIDPLPLYGDENLENWAFDDSQTNDDIDSIPTSSINIKKMAVDKGKKRAGPFNDESDDNMERLVKNEQEDDLNLFEFESRIPKDVLKVMKTVGISESVDTVSKKLTAEKRKRRRQKKKTAPPTGE